MTMTLYCVLAIPSLLDSDFRHKCPILDISLFPVKF